MGNVFRKAKATKITQQDKAVLQLKQQRDKLRQYQRRVETSLENDRQLAISLISEGKRDRALLLLRKKRFQETLLSNADKQLHNIEKLASDIEFAQVETQVVEGLKVGSKALKELNDAMNLDDIEQLLEESKEAFDKQQEISAMLAGVLTLEDEESVIEELDKLVQEEAERAPSNTASGDSEKEEREIDLELPDVPKEKIKVREEESRQLEAPLEA